ncbi:MAG: MTAP family purine nucleoside phosphorylase [Chloroflexi bacterium]|nr:MTAP family purine nucleoside phosphorylase [Chloroflexota bacterium]
MFSPPASTSALRFPISVLIIGGTAAYGLDLATYGPVADPIILDTPFGPSPPITFLQPDPKQPPVAFCSRHGADQLRRSAAFVNHRALIWAARMIGASRILSWNGAGAIAEWLEVGHLVAPHDIIDFTRGRTATFGLDGFAPASGPAFQPAARAAIIEAVHALKHAAVFHERGVYVCTEGPRLETAAEIALYAQAGADLVGMTLSPEVFLAQEAGIAYASLCYITNYATGRAGNRPARREFGPVVANTCLPILLRAASTLHPLNGSLAHPLSAPHDGPMRR